MQTLIPFALLMSAASAVGLDGRGQAFLAADGAVAMRPEDVAEKLARVEDRWEDMATSFVECMEDSNSTGVDGNVRGWGNACSNSARDFVSSCATVVGAMVQGSSGQRGVVKEYMLAVCNAGPLKDWKQERCQLIATEVDAAMSDDSYSNRENLNLTTACGKCWSRYTEAAGARYKKEKAEREAEEKVRAEEEAKAAAERRKAEEKEAAEAAAEAKRQEAEAAKARAADAQAKAEAAAKTLEERRAEEAAQKAKTVDAAEKVDVVPKVLQNSSATTTGNATARSLANETAAPNTANQSNATVE